MLLFSFQDKKYLEIVSDGCNLDCQQMADKLFTTDGNTQ